MIENIFVFDRYRAKKILFLRYFFKGYFPLFCELTSGSESNLSSKIRVSYLYMTLHNHCYCYKITFCIGNKQMRNLNLHDMLNFQNQLDQRNTQIGNKSIIKITQWHKLNSLSENHGQVQKLILVWSDKIIKQDVLIQVVRK